MEMVALQEKMVESHRPGMTLIYGKVKASLLLSLSFFFFFKVKISTEKA